MTNPILRFVGLFCCLSLTSCATGLTVAPPLYDTSEKVSVLETGTLTLSLPTPDQDLRAKILNRWSADAPEPYNHEAFEKALAYASASLDLEGDLSSKNQSASSRYAALILYGRLMPRAHTGLPKPVFLSKDGWGNLDRTIRRTFPLSPSSDQEVAAELSLWFDSFGTDRSMESGPFAPVGTAFCIAHLSLRLLPAGEERNIYAFADEEYSTFKSTVPTPELAETLYSRVLEVLGRKLHLQSWRP